MPPAKKTRTPDSNPKVRQIEFTPGQMIIAICTLIVFGLVCFMLGVLVNKLDTTFSPEGTTTAAAPAQTEPGVTAPPETGQAPAPRPQQTSPIPPESLRGPVASRNETAEPSSPSQPRTVAPPSATRRPSAPEPAAPAEVPRPTAPVAPDPPQESAPEVTADEPEPTAPETVLENVELMTPEEPDDSAETTTQPPPPAAGSTAYGVQVASVSAEREEQARRALAEAERVSEQKGRLVPSDDGRLLRLIVGSFGERAEATRLMESMRQHSQYEGCFVQTFTQPL